MPASEKIKDKFRSGCAMATPAALNRMRANGVLPRTLLDRHVTGDWGEFDEDGDPYLLGRVHTQIFMQLPSDRSVQVLILILILGLRHALGEGELAPVKRRLEATLHEYQFTGARWISPEQRGQGK